MKIYTLVAAGLLSSGLYAQKQGTITYLEKVKMEIQLDSATLAMLGDQFPSETTVQKQLLFNEEGSLYTTVPKKEDSRNIEQEEGRRIEIRMDAPNEKLYTDLKNSRRVEQRDFMGKLFLIDTALTKPEWKMTGKQKSLLNYPCQQAMKISPSPMRSNQIDTIYAWFTPALPVSTGPNGLHGLPGTILEMDMGNGRVNVVAQTVDLVSPDVKTLVKPKEGKKVKPYEFRNIVAEKTKEMQEQNGGSGNVIIKVERR